MEILCTICARAGSKGLKNKNFLKIKGNSLILHSLKQALKIKKIDNIVVSSDSNKFKKKVHKKITYLQRPNILSGDKVGKLDVIRHALKHSENYFKKNFDMILDLDVTSPLRRISDINNCINLFKKKKSNNLITICDARKNPYFNMIEYSGTEIKLVKSIKGSSSPQSRQVAPQVYDMNASIYIWKRDSLFNDPSLINKYTVLHEMPEDRSIDIDTIIDWHLVELLMKLNLKK